jgi:transposase
MMLFLAIIYVEQIRKAHPELEMAYQIGQGLVMMLAERRGNDLDSRLTQAEHSGLPEFKKMAKGIRLDYAAGNRRVFFRVESRSGRSAGQLLKAKAPHRVRQSEL